MALETRTRTPFEKIALALQGGGALGAYQAGVYEALATANICPDWIAGISIAAINGALIAGNAPEVRVAKLRVFWERITTKPYCDWSERLLPANGDAARQSLNRASAYFTLGCGAHGFFTPRFLAPWLHPPYTTAATSFYDTNRLRQTLEDLVDFDRINAQRVRFSVSAVNVRSGNFVYFDTTIAEVTTRQKEIQYSSRTRAGTDNFEHIQQLRRALDDLFEKLPASLRDGTEAELLRPLDDHKVYNIVHLIYLAKNYEGQSKDYDFSRASMEEHWLAGYHDAVRTLRHPEVLERPSNHEGFFTFDLAHDGRE
jgi:predicted acylesterase/phospholipase RssA